MGSKPVLARQAVPAVRAMSAVLRRGLYVGRLAGCRCTSLAAGMPPISYSGSRFPPDITQRAVWMYLCTRRARGFWPTAK
jgi:hypothetical protein